MTYGEFVAGLAIYDKIGAGNDELTLLIMKKKEKEVLDYIKTFHTAAVSCVGGSGRYAGSWQTYVGRGRSGRKLVRAATLEGLLEALAGFYGLKEEKPEKEKKPETLQSYFLHWLEWKGKRNGNKSGTLYHNRVDFERLVSGTKLSRLPLDEITTEDLDEWARGVLIEKPLSAQRWNTYKICVTGPLELALREGLIKGNPWKPELMDFRRLYKSSRRAPSKDKIFYDDEVERIIEQCMTDFVRNGNSANIAIIINFDLGLRVGELAALKWEDIDQKAGTICIRRQESEGKVEEYVKSDSAAGYRELPLNDHVMGLLRRIRDGRLSGYIFVDDSGRRKTASALQKRLIYAQVGKNGDTAGCGVKRIHCQRRTVGTRIAKALGLEAARQWLGHTDIATTLRYIYTTETLDSMREYSQAASALAGLQPGKKAEPVPLTAAAK